MDISDAYFGRKPFQGFAAPKMINTSAASMLLKSQSFFAELTKFSDVIATSNKVSIIGSLTSQVISSQKTIDGAAALIALQSQVTAPWSALANQFDIAAVQNIMSSPAFHIPSVPLAMLWPSEIVTKLARMHESLTRAGFDFGQVEDWYPRNWPEDVDLWQMNAIATDDGIPLVWVAPAQVIEKIAAASDRDERLALLLDYKDEILQSCQNCLDEITVDKLDKRAVFMTQALSSLRNGDFGPAQVMAVALLDGFINQDLGVNLNSHTAIKKRYGFNPDRISARGAIYAYTMAPLISFAEQWSPKSPKPKPLTLTRHLTIHYAGGDQINMVNALVAVMLATSIFRTAHETLTSQGRRSNRE